MKEYRKNFFLTFLSVILAYFVGKLYDSVFTNYLPKDVSSDPLFLVVTSSIFILILGTAIYCVIYHDRKDFLKWKPGKE